jgi:hypothetical protein
MNHLMTIEKVNTNIAMTKNDSPAATRMGEPHLEISVLLIYEDGSTGLRAKRALDHVLNQREVMAEGRFHVWGMDLLRNRDCQAEATREALHADIIVVSAHGPNRLVPEAEACLKRWMGLKRGRPCALVLSLDTDAKPPGESNPALLGLRAEAARNGLTVLLQFGEATRPEINTAIAGIRRRADATPAALEQILHRSEPHPRWGLNE